MTVSIIVPVYNAENYIERCIKSLLHQTFANIEIILIDDGSFDNSLKICRFFAETDERIKVISQSNSGVSAARNRGIMSASGAFITFVDADDWVEDKHIEKLVEAMDSNGMAVVGVINGQHKNVHFTNQTTLSKQEALISVLDAKGMCGYTFNKLYDRELMIEKSIFFDEDVTICEDVLYIVKYLLETTGEISVVPYDTYHYETNLDSALCSRFIGKGFSEKWFTEIEAFRRAAEITSQYPSVSEYCHQREAKSAVTVLRAMVANKYYIDSRYCELKHMMRKNVVAFLRNPIWVSSSKLSMILSVVSPRLEYAVWKICQRTM